MNLRRILLGNSKGKTGWQKLKGSWARDRKREERARAYGELKNPLGLNCGDKVELAELSADMFEVKAVVDCCPEGRQEHDPTTLRYLLTHVADVDELCIEATTNGDKTFYTQFEAVDEFEFDPDFLEVLENEPKLRQTVKDDDGEQQLDYERESESFLSLNIYHADGDQRRQVRSFNYVRQSGEDEEYLLVEIDDEDGWTTIQLGHPLHRSAITAYGAAHNP